MKIYQNLWTLREENIKVFRYIGENGYIYGTRQSQIPIICHISVNTQDISVLYKSIFSLPIKPSFCTHVRIEQCLDSHVLVDKQTIPTKKKEEIFFLSNRFLLYRKAISIIWKI